MKHVSRIVIALVLAVLVITIMPAQVFAESLPEYISEVKVYIGDYKDAEKEGFKILNGDDGDPVNLNKSAGGGLGSEGDKAVYLGYKTTTNRKEAITDLALMNMKGGYSVQDYEVLMESQLKSQILPFVEKIQVTIDEYRENLKSENDANKNRAEFIKSVLNKFIDDDTGKGLGDLFENETLYERAKRIYDALPNAEKAKTSIYDTSRKLYDKMSEEERKEHADLVTIMAQSNGQATLVMFNLLTRAADTNEESWVERFTEITYDDLVDSLDMAPADAESELAKLYDDDAQEILDMWDKFKTELESYEQTAEKVDKYDADESELDGLETQIESIDENTDDEKVIDTAIDLVEKSADALETLDDIGTVAVYEYLENTEYADGTLLDFFMQDYDDIADDITVLYPLVASLTDGQRAGLDFMSLKNLIYIAETDSDAFADSALKDFEEVSIYKDVDRGIYQKGGVALTSDALRKNADAMAAAQGDESLFSPFTVAMMALTGASVVGFLASGIAKITIANQLSNKTAYITKMANLDAKYTFRSLDKTFTKTDLKNLAKIEEFNKNKDSLIKETGALTKQNQLCNKLVVGFTVAMVVISAITTYLAWQDMKDHYKVDFTPVPKYMVDEKDIVSYNAKGEKIVLKNQSAYYKVAESNLKKGDFKFDEIGAVADMNGCVGKQWLALYVNINEANEPILASSLKVVTKSSELPAGYTKGIHMFGSDAAFNLNSNLYDWNESAPSIFVYFKTDSSAASATGTTFTGGTLALTGGAGIALGAVVTALAMKTTSKKKETPEAA